MSQVAFTTLPMMNNLMNLQSTLNVCDYESSATMSSIPSPSMYSTSSPDTRDGFISPTPYMISAEALGILMPMEGPSLHIIEQPVDKFRFRYKSEMMGTHGSILAKSSDKSRKRLYPTVMLHNYSGEAIIRCSLYTAHPNESMRTPHTHRLVVRVGNEDKDDPHEIKVSASNNYTAIFQGMGIIHTAKKHIADELIRKKRALKLEQLQQRNVNVTSLPIREEAEIRTEAEAEAKRMNLNSVTLCFEAFEDSHDRAFKQICKPVFSSAINNMKSALTGELKICRIDKHTSSCLGGDEVFILVEKVGKKNIKIKFFELDDEDNEIWCDFGKFSELDVHHQYAIVFRTPPYRDTEIDKVVDVFLQLYRPTDGDCSEAIKFAYKPSEKIGRKRQRMSMTDNIPNCVQQDTELARSLVNIDISDNVPLFSGIETISSSLNSMLGDPRISSNDFLEFMQRFSNSGNFTDYVAALPEPSQNLTDRLSYPQNNAHIAFDAAGVRSLNGNKSTVTPMDPSNIKNEMSIESTLPRQIIDEVKRNASLKKPKFNDRIMKLFYQKSDGGNCALHAAIIHRQMDLLKDMLDLLAREPRCSLLNHPNDKHQTPLHTAAVEQPVSVKWLLNAGADPNIQDKDGNTPLHIAVMYNANECVDEILSQDNYKYSELKADLNERNAAGWTPVHLGVLHKNSAAIEKIVSAGANVNEQDTNGRTVLHIAAEESDLKIATYIVKHTNIDINKKDLSGYTALDRARVAVGKKYSSELCELLGHTEVEAQMETESNITRIKREPMDSDEELQIDEDDDDEEEEDDDEEEEEDRDNNNSVHNDETKSTFNVDDDEHILSLLQGVTHSPERQVKTPEIMEVKEEIFASPVSECTIPDENGLFSSETLTQLCDILDANGSWANLADLLGYNFLIASIKDATSPSKLLFNYADVDGGVTVQDIRNFLGLLDEHKAVELVDLMLAGQES